MLLDKGSLAIREIAASERTRYALNGVLVERDRIVATDGRMLAVVLPPTEIPTDEVPLVPGVDPVDPPQFDSFIVPATFIQKLEKNVPAVRGNLGPRVNVVQLDTKKSSAHTGIIDEKKKPEPRKLVCGITDFEDYQVLETREVDGSFPHLDEVIPQGPIAVSVTLNYEYLAKLCKVAKAIRKAEGEGADSRSITIDIPAASIDEKSHHVNGPFLVRPPDGACSQRLLGILMPVVNETRVDVHRFSAVGARAAREYAEDERRRAREAAEKIAAEKRKKEEEKKAEEAASTVPTPSAA